MPTCVPVREMKDTAAFAALVESANGPVTVTKNGRDAFVVMTSAEYDGMREEMARMRLYGILLEAEAEYNNGDYVEGTSYISKIRSRYGL